MTLYNDVVVNEYGFYTLKNPPSDKEREEYYRNVYYSKDSIGYTIHYTDAEKAFFYAKLEQKLLLVEKYASPPFFPRNKCSILDVGCGEGFALAFFKEKGFSITGLDYADMGIRNHNGDVLSNVIFGDIYDCIAGLVEKSARFDVINMDNVLEHVTNPKLLLEQLRPLMAKNGIVIIKVPNDFSVLQQYFFDSGIVTKPHWVTSPDHISYFNRDGLIELCRSVGFVNLDILGNYLTEFFILNPNTNYLENPAVGKSCHFARVAMENIFHGISPEKTVELYRIFGDMGLGREIIGVFRAQEEE